MSPLRFVDLFAGIGGFHLALADPEFQGECVFASEIDPACQAVYRDAFGHTPDGDIRLITGADPAAVPDHDVLCAGFPCQPFSKSGHQRGMDETRGTLFWDILRILEAKRPPFFILENVRNLAGPRQLETWHTIIRRLRALGYQVSSNPLVISPHRLPPDLDGRPQVRERVFILGRLLGESASSHELEAAPVSVPDRFARWSPADWRIDDWLQDDADIPDLAPYALRREEVRWLSAWNELLNDLPAEPLPGFPIWADAFVGRPRFAGDTPLWKRNFLEKNSRFYRANKSVIDRWMRRHNELEGFPPSRRKFEWQAQQSDRDVWQLVIHLRPSGIRVKSGTYLPALVAITQTSIIGWRRRRITPREAARLQGFPDDFPLHPVDAIAYHQLGNAVNVGVVKHVARALIASEKFDSQVQLALGA